MKKSIFMLVSVILMAVCLSFPSFAADSTSCEHVYSNGFCYCGGFEPCTGSGTAEDPYLIGNGGQLYSFALLVNSGNNTAHGKLVSDVRVNSAVITPSGDLLPENDYLGWIFIGYENADGCVLYNGNFDGDGHTVSGLFCDSADIPYVGLFGNIGKNGTVKNVTVSDSYIKGFFYAGGIAGYSKGNIENCHSSATVVGSCAGGIAGVSYGSVEGCKNLGKAAGQVYTAGIVSENYGPVDNCENLGQVAGEGTTGGITGDNFGSVTDCKNSAEVVGRNQTGGIVGGNYASAESCENHGNVFGNEKVGGIVGYNANGSQIYKCFNKGSVSGDSYTGGVLGHNFPGGTVISCYNLGDVIAGSAAGGVVGFNGMIDGYHEDSGCAVKDCYSIGSVSGISGIGGVAGHSSTYNTVTNCYFDSTVFDGSAFGGRDESNDGEPVTWVTGLDSAKFKNGEAAYLLGGDFGQVIGKDSHPVLGGNKVFRSIAGGCTEESYRYAYSNTETADTPSHSFTEATCTEAALCKACGLVESEALGHDFANVYTIDVEASKDSHGIKSRHCKRCTERTDITEFESLTDSSLIFNDVKPKSWFKGAVDYAVTKNLMNGMTSTTFRPNIAMSRAMLVTVLWRLEGSPETQITVPFTDLRQVWYRDAVAWAYANGVVMGTDEDTFSPGADVTREQIATILYRYSARKGYDTTARADISAYPDADGVHSYAADAVSWTNANGLITGSIGKNGILKLAPQESATRAQIATILMRFSEMY